MRFYQESLPGNCSVGVIWGYNDPSNSYYEEPREDLDNLYAGGTGLFCAGFIDTDRCKAAFEELKAKYKILLQTKPRFNENSGNDCIFCVYDRKWPNFTPDMNAKKVWPFTESK